MKSLCVTIILILCFFGVSFAEPFLSCDAPPSNEGVTSYFIVIDGGTEVETPAPLHYDLSGLDDGDHLFDVCAKNVWDRGKSVPFPFTKRPPSEAQGIVVSTE